MVWIGFWLATLVGARAAFPAERFEESVFPPAGWTNSGITTVWSRSSGVSGYGTGTASAKANFYNVSSGTGVLETAVFEASAEGDTLAFDFAYATYGGEVDRLRVYGSTDQGGRITSEMDQAIRQQREQLHGRRLLSRLIGGWN